MVGIEAVGSSSHAVERVKKSEPDPATPSSPGIPDKIPGGVKSIIARVDEVLVRISKLIQTSAGLTASLTTLNFSLSLAAYLHARSPTRADLIAILSRFLGRTPSRAVLGVLLSKAAPSLSFLTPTASLLSDWRKTLRLTSLIPLYIRLKTLTSKETSGNMDPVLHRVVLLQCSAYIAFQTLENVSHLHAKGVVPSSIVEKHGGLARWTAWCCRAWCVGVLCDFLRLWREADLERKRKCKTAQDQADYNRNWWTDFTVAACWLPVAVHNSFYPEGIWGMNAGTVVFLSLVAGLSNFRKQWQATA